MPPKAQPSAVFVDAMFLEIRLAPRWPALSRQAAGKVQRKRAYAESLNLAEFGAAGCQVIKQQNCESCTLRQTTQPAHVRVRELRAALEVQRQRRELITWKIKTASGL